MNAAAITAMRQMCMQYGPGAVQLGSEYQAPTSFSTGLDRLDEITGGIRRGSIVEIFGAEGSGKSTLALHLARQAGEVLYLDADHGLGAVGGGLYVMRPDRLEDALRVVELAAPAFDAVVIDTVAALPTREEARLPLCGDSEYRLVKPSARCLAHALPRLVPLLHKHGCTLFLVNQMRDIPSALCGRREKPTGGRAIRHYASLQLEPRRVQYIQARDKVRGEITRVTVRKSKQCAPYGEAVIGMVYAYGGANLCAIRTVEPSAAGAMRATELQGGAQGKGGAV